jgi:hypothetical protein
MAGTGGVLEPAHHVQVRLRGGRCPWNADRRARGAGHVLISSAPIVSVTLSATDRTSGRHARDDATGCRRPGRPVKHVEHHLAALQRPQLAGVR